MKVMRTPKSVDLAITNRCNLRCKYCSHFTSAGDVGQDLPKEEWLQFFAELNRCAVMDVTLQGGEPFYRGDLKELIEGIVRVLERRIAIVISAPDDVPKPSAHIGIAQGRRDALPGQPIVVLDRPPEIEIVICDVILAQNLLDDVILGRSGNHRRAVQQLLRIRRCAGWCRYS